ncbi:hypothetical protein SanaruYs_22560 [Chryseotalea sanaruensis]|uniref:Uncharacterized protein n=1 Tax=Chryseotalea sanaruensis TaxID=2482724 RepID=A0A401UAZ5_9BACT|nr:hypothetical protein [Chryseotalea sanaruensis]GCC52024.1 hypothetical protein SanaruYs_22560 [Chryseotalea sanaruensis]
MNQKNKIATLILGVTTAVVVVFSQLFCFQDFSIDAKSDGTEQSASTENESDKTTENYITQLSSPSTSSSSIVVEQDFSFIQDIKQQVKEVKQELVSTLVVRTSKFFQTLFSAIISPNAP